VVFVNVVVDGVKNIAVLAIITMMFITISSLWC